MLLSFEQGHPELCSDIRSGNPEMFWKKSGNCEANDIKEPIVSKILRFLKF